MRKQLICDQQLVSQYILGDESALALIIERHKEKIFDYILNIVKKKEVAEDIFQDTFFKVIQTLKKGQYNEEGKFLSWVLCIAHHQVMDYFRMSKKKKTISTLKNNEGIDVEIYNILVLPEQNCENRIVKTQVRKKVRRLIRCLDIEQREVIILRHYFGMSFKEISERMEIPLNTALGRMHYALINLNKIIKAQDLDFDKETLYPQTNFNEKQVFFNPRTIIY